MPKLGFRNFPNQDVREVDTDRLRWYLCNLTRLSARKVKMIEDELARREAERQAALKAQEEFEDRLNRLGIRLAPWPFDDPDIQEL
jgi:hypothetical protein